MRVVWQLHRSPSLSTASNVLSRFSLLYRCCCSGRHHWFSCWLSGRSKPEVLGKVVVSCVAMLVWASCGMHATWHTLCVPVPKYPCAQSKLSPFVVWRVCVQHAFHSESTPACETGEHLLSLGQRIRCVLGHRTKPPMSAQSASANAPLCATCVHSGHVLRCERSACLIH